MSQHKPHLPKFNPLIECLEGLPDPRMDRMPHWFDLTARPAFEASDFRFEDSVVFPEAEPQLRTHVRRYRDEPIETILELEVAEITGQPLKREMAAAYGWQSWPLTLPRVPCRSPALAAGG